MIILRRFSRDGFEPKTQQLHYNYLLESVKPPDTTGLNAWQRKAWLERYENYLPLAKAIALADYQMGVFAFIGGLPERQWVDHELNHLREEEVKKRRWFTAEIVPTAALYSVYGLVPELYTAQEYLREHWIGVAAYVPARSLTNIKEQKCL